MHTAPPRPESRQSPNASPDSAAPTDPEPPDAGVASDSAGSDTSEIPLDPEIPDATSNSAVPDSPLDPEISGRSPSSGSAVDSDGSPRFSRALLALTAAATIAVAPLAASALGPADSGQSAHSIPVYLISRVSHDIGHNDWAFQGQNAGRVDWVVSYLALGLFWLVIALWMRARVRRFDKATGNANADTGDTRNRLRLWRHVLIAAWSVEAVVGFLTLGAGAYAAWTSTPLGPAVLRAADLCSPWWSCVAAILVVARAERSTSAFRAVIGYALLLAIVLLIPVPGPDAVKVLLLALPAAIPALTAADSAPSGAQNVRRDAVAAG